MNVKETLNKVLERFESGDIPEAVALSCFPQIEVPMAKWSLLNRIIVFFSGTRDARGIRQWHSVDRYPVKGSKAIHILAPVIKKNEKNDDSVGTEMAKTMNNSETTRVVHGFMLVPVFRAEDTGGKPLVYPELAIPDLPLLERATEWGISIKPVSGNTYYYGAYSQKRNEIVLASPEESVFFHELCHSAHHRIKGSLVSGQDWKQEIVAELGAVVLCRLVGKEPDRVLGNSYRYIVDYVEKAKMSPLGAMMQVLGDTEKVLTLIMKGGEYAVQTNSSSLENGG